MEQFRRGELTFDVRDAGPRDGEPVVLLHGFPQDGSCWDGVVPALHAAGLRTLVPDQRGYSPGARPRGRGAYRIAECALDVVALLDAAGVERAHVVGHDWGGFVAWWLAGNQETRVRTATVLSTPHPAAVARGIVRGPQALRSAYIAAFQAPLVPEILLPRVLDPMLRRSGLPAEHAARYTERLTGGALGPALGWYRALPWSLRSPAGRSRVPTTYVWGRKDVALGPESARVTARYVAAPYRYVELDAGHWLPETCADEVAGFVLDRVRGRA